MLAPSYIHKSSLATGSAALEAEVRKTAKYTALRVAHTSVPIAVETFGAWGPRPLHLYQNSVDELTGEVRFTVYLRKRIDIALQRGYSASVLGTLNSPLPHEFL